MPIRIMPIIFLVVPIIEISVFIVVGGQIGVGFTILLILLTAVIGTLLLRQQGFGILARIRDDVNAGRVPAAAMAHGVLIIVAGVLLLTPGFVTDGLGFLIFVPRFRDWVWRAVAPGFFAHLSGSWSRWPGAGDDSAGYHPVIDGSTAPPADAKPGPGDSH